MADWVLPGWVLPPDADVSRVRERSRAYVVDEAVDGVLHEPPPDLGIMLAIDWVAGLSPVSPLTVLLDAPLPRRVVVERLLAFELMSGRPVSDAEYERYGYAPLYPNDKFADVRYAGGVWHALEWLLGETEHEPGIRYEYRPPAAG